MTPEQIEQMKETMDPETHADGFTPFWGYVVSWEKYKDMAEHIIAQREQIEAMEKRVDSADALPEIADDVIRASNTMMLMLSGDLSMTKPSLEAALRRALDARNAWDNGLSAYRAAREGKA